MAAFRFLRAYCTCNIYLYHITIQDESQLGPNLKNLLLRNEQNCLYDTKHIILEQTSSLFLQFFL
jgi:hypothetical protein